MQLRKPRVIMEKRTDLASLFCMIGRHGPAVAVVVIAVVSVVAGFIIYRSVKGKRRKAAAGDGEGVSRGAASLLDTEPEPQSDVEERRDRAESTGTAHAEFTQELMSFGLVCKSVNTGYCCRNSSFKTIGPKDKDDVVVLLKTYCNLPAEERQRWGECLRNATLSNSALFQSNCTCSSFTAFNSDFLKI